MKIRFIKQWRRRKIDSEADMPDGVANLLVRRKFAVHFETAAIEPATETAALRTKAPKRKRETAEV